MAILLDGTGGVTTPGVVNTAGETIATTLSVTGVTTLTGGLNAALPVLSGGTGVTTKTGTGAVVLGTAPTITGATITVAATAAPAFSAYLSAHQSISTAVLTKIQANTEEFDTASAYDNATNYRFTPLVAGYYQCEGRMESNVSGTNAFISVYKNGFEAKRGETKVMSFNAGTATNVAILIYLNGTTDYIEFYGYINGTSPVIGGGAIGQYIQAAMIRSA